MATKPIHHHFFLCQHCHSIVLLDTGIVSTEHGNKTYTSPLFPVSTLCHSIVLLDTGIVSTEHGNKTYASPLFPVSTLCHSIVLLDTGIVSTEHGNKTYTSPFFPVSTLCHSIILLDNRNSKHRTWQQNLYIITFSRVNTETLLSRSLPSELSVMISHHSVRMPPHWP